MLSANTRTTRYLLGIEGDVQYGKRTRQEWTFLQEDIDKHILDRKVHARPSNMRVSFENFPGVVEKFASQPDTYVLVASCPARIGDNHRVMEDVKEIVTGKPWSPMVDLVFSSADSAAAAEFHNMEYVPVTSDNSGGGGGGAAAVTTAANQEGRTAPDTLLFEAQVRKKPHKRAMFGVVSWDTRWIRLYRDVLRYGSMTNGRFVEKTPPNGNSPLPINSLLNYEIGKIKEKTGGADIEVRFFYEHSAPGAEPYAIETFRLESEAERAEFVEKLDMLKAEHARAGGNAARRSAEVDKNAAAAATTAALEEERRKEEEKAAAKAAAAAAKAKCAKCEEKLAVLEENLSVRAYNDGGFCVHHEDHRIAEKKTKLLGKTKWKPLDDCPVCVKAAEDARTAVISAKAEETSTGARYQQLAGLPKVPPSSAAASSVLVAPPSSPAEDRDGGRRGQTVEAMAASEEKEEKKKKNKGSGSRRRVSESSSRTSFVSEIVQRKLDDPSLEVSSTAVLFSVFE